MKSASAATIALLAGNEFIYADLYTITLTNGTILYRTTADLDLVYNGHTFLSGPPLIKASKVKTEISMSVATMNLTMFGGINELIGNFPLPQFASLGGFDGAEVKVDRCFMATWGDTSAGVVNVFDGIVTSVKPSRTQVDMTVSAYTVLLNVNMPRNLFQPSCINTLFDSGCTVLRSSYQATGLVTAGSTTGTINNNTNQPAGYFDQGRIIFTSGANSGMSRTIKSQTVGVFTLTYPLPNAPAVNDTFTAYPGCDKTNATCGTKFSNTVNFKATPYVPAPQTLL